MSSPFEVLVLGDVSIDRRAIRVDWSRPSLGPSGPKWQQQQGLRSFDIPGGAWFVAACIKRALSPSVSITHEITNAGFEWATIEAVRLTRGSLMLEGGRITIDRGEPGDLGQALVVVGDDPPPLPDPPPTYVLKLRAPLVIETLERSKNTDEVPDAPGTVDLSCRSLESDGYALRNAKGVSGTIVKGHFHLVLAAVVPQELRKEDTVITVDRHFSIEGTRVVEADFRDASFGRAVFGGKTHCRQNISVGNTADADVPHVTTFSPPGDPTSLVHSWAELDLFPPRPGDKGGKVYRISTLRGFAGPERELVSGINPPEPFPAALPSGYAPAGRLILVIEDQGNGYRDDEQCLDDLERFLARAALIVYKSTKSFPLRTSRFWTILQRHHDRVVAIVSADALRDLGINLAYGLSWERVAEDLSAALRNGILEKLSSFRHLIVRLCLSGAALIGRGHTASEIKRVFFDPAEIEGTFRAPDRDGVLTGYNSVLVGSIIAALAKADFGPKPTDPPSEAALVSALETGIRAGLQSCRAYFDAGLGRSVADLARLMETVLPEDEGRPTGTTEFGEASCEEFRSQESSASFSFFEEACKFAQPEGVAKLARAIVNMGMTNAFAELKPKEKFPFARFGDNLLVVDRAEIEGYRSISTLIRNYADHPAAPRPLSLGVFGAPGAGKSFGVKQIALNLMGPGRVKFLEANLAQFSSPDDLADVFFSVRDVTLQAGQLPVVFFDEFDAQLGTSLGWLKYFLAPMQDGRFKYKQTTLGIGKAIFVFAGGTRAKYEHLGGKPQTDDPAYDSYVKADYELNFPAKVKDFKRRLRGTVDIANINEEATPTGAPSKPGAGPDQLVPDETLPSLYLIRRAILFRSLLGKLAPHLLDDRRARVDEGVIRAFLGVSKYEHGAGSMEAILEISSVRNQQFFTKAALPARRLLAMHVDAATFLRELDGSRRP